MHPRGRLAIRHPRKGSCLPAVQRFMRWCSGSFRALEAYWPSAPFALEAPEGPAAERVDPGVCRESCSPDILGGASVRPWLANRFASARMASEVVD
mmetsp:Transcript_46818/g.136250  ORF Transcript_46818/g.136250 Transcript_46818/m.136250 type:complete len:96 (+) Transcript_46818:1593-1880(+)